MAHKHSANSFVRPHLPALVILALFISLSVVYSIADPVFEASDEINHYPFVAYLAHGKGLPTQHPGDKTLWEQEGSQPPLYYALSAALTAWINTDDLPTVLARNPHARVGVPLAQDNKNMIVHTNQEAFPWHGSVLAVHVIRLFSILLSAGTILCTYGLGRQLFPAQPSVAIGAMALNAFIPMFLFVSASVNNDNLVTLLCSLALLVLVRFLMQAGNRRIPTGQLIGLGVLIGLACLSKLGALGLIPLAAFALALHQFSSREAFSAPQHMTADRSPILASIRRWISECVTAFIPAAAVAGWWYWRNWQLYRDPTGLNTFLDIVGRRPVNPSLLDLLGEFQGFRINFWGLFGGVNVLLRPTWIYYVLDGFSVLAVLGLAIWVGRTIVGRRQKAESSRQKGLLLLATWIAIELVSLIRWTLSTTASQGRLLFPAISAICLFFVLGLTKGLPGRYGRAVAWGFGGFMFLLAATAPFTAIRPAYARPSILTAADVPATAQPFNVDYGGVMRLLAFEIDTDHVQPGGSLPVTLYFQALAPMKEDYSVYIQLFGWHQDLGQEDTYPGGGNYPTHLWSVGQVVGDTVLIPVRQDAMGPAPAWVSAGLYRFATKEKLPAVDQWGKQVVFPILTEIELNEPTPTFKPKYPLNVNLDNRVRLIGYDLDSNSIQAGGAAPLTLYWQVIGKLDHNYKVFIHVVDEQGMSAGQGDGLPLDNFYPTSRWRIGEILNDTHRITIQDHAPSGNYSVFAGLTDPDTGQRLPILDTVGKSLDNQTLITAIKVQNSTFN